MIRIIADSTCDLSPEVVDLYGIKIISSYLLIDGQHLKDYDYYGEALDEFYVKLANVKEPSEYEPPSVEKYVELLDDGVFNGITEFIIFIPSSHTIRDFGEKSDAAIQTFIQANKVQNVKVHVVDTLGVSSGFGYSVLKAAKMAKQGASYDEIVDFCEKNKTKVRHMLAVTDMEFLEKTGNVTKASAKASEMLGITPVLTLKRGKGSLIKKAIGSSKIVEFYASEFKKTADMENTDFVIIGYSSDIEKAKEVRRLVFKETNFGGEMYIMQMRPAFGANAGRNAVSMFFLSKKSGFSFINLFGH